MKTAGWIVVLLGLAGCGYRPPPQTNIGSASYQRDLASCRGSASAGIDKQNAKRALTWFAGPVRRWGQIDRATSTCMENKGHGRLRWCIGDELERGKRTGGVVVTPEGIQCTDPPRPPAT